MSVTPHKASAGSRITAVDTYDIRFPTSRELDGSDAMNPDPDYSAAYAVLRTDAGDGLEGHGFAFTIGRGNEIQVAALDALRPHLTGRRVDDMCADPGSVSRDLVGDSQLRWLGPEKGVMHMAIGAVVNATWDLAAKRDGKPLWRFLADAGPEWLVSQVDFRYIEDALAPDQALALLRRGRDGAARREAALREHGYPGYTTSPGWLGYSDDKLTRLAKEAVADGFTQIKLKVAPTSTTTSGACGRRGRPWAPTSGSTSTPTSGGAYARPWRGRALWPRSTRTGSRSPPAPTTSSATPRSAGRCTR